MQARTLFIFLTAFCLLFSAKTHLRANVQSPVVKTTLDDSGFIDIAQNFSVHLDEKGTLSIEDILKLKVDAFSPGHTQSINPGYTSNHYWLNLELSNKSHLVEWYLVPDFPITNFEAYRVLPDGSYQKAEVEKIETRYPIRKIALAPGEDARIILHFSSPLVVNLQLKILDAERLKTRLANENTFIGIITGIFVAMIFYNFFVYLNIKDRDYLYYIAFALVNTHLNLLSANYPEGIYDWFGLDWMNLVQYYRPMAPFTTFLFARYFLQTHTEHPKLDKVLLAYMGSLLLLIPFPLFLSPAELYQIHDLWFLPGVFLLIAAGIVSLRRGFKPSHVYLFGLGLFVLGIFIYILKSEGLLASNAWTMNAHLLLQAFEMLLISLAISSKIKQLETSKTKAEATANVKSRLLRVISHDIANPLSIIKGSTYIMKRERVAPDRVEAISRSVSMIEDIMSFIQKTESMESGRKIEVKDVAIAEIFDSLSFTFQKVAADKNVALLFEMDNPLLGVRGEKTCLTFEVIGNFVGNAIKFSHINGTVRVTASLESGRVIIKVIDQGLGMSTKVADKAFDPSVNVSRKGTAGEKGHGYGLLIAKAYIEQFGGEVSIKSVSQDVDPKNSGTTVVLSLLPAQSYRAPELEPTSGWRRLS